MGNTSCNHQAGQRAKRAIEQARRLVAALINAKPEEISCTSCGTEANNWALRGLFAANKRKGNSLDSSRTRLSDSLGTPPHGPGRGAPHLIISAIEHPSVSLVARRLEVDGGAKVTILPVDREGFVSPSDLKAAITPETVLVSIMLANGEVGTIEPIQEMAAVTHEHGALFHTDAVAAVGGMPVDVRALGIDALSLAADQFYGPQGAATLFVREGVRILPLLEGGGQEHGGRSGTENVAAIAGMGVAAEIAKRDLSQRMNHCACLRDRLRDGLQERIEGLRINGPADFRRVTRSHQEAAGRSPAAPGTPIGHPLRGYPASVAGPVESHEETLACRRLPHNLHVCIDGVSSEALVLGLDQAGIAAGLGSACNSKAMRPSHVLKAMGLTDEQAKGALVLTVGMPTTDEEIDRALEAIARVVMRLRRVITLTIRA